MLRREVEGLPEEILSTLKAEQPAAPAEREPRSRGGAPREEREQREERDEHEEGAERGEPRAEREEDDEDEDGRQADEREEDEDGQPAAPRKPRPVYESKTIPPRDASASRAASAIATGAAAELSISTRPCGKSRRTSPRCGPS